MRFTGIMVVVFVVAVVQQATSGAIVQWIGNGHYYDFIGNSVPPE
jgi:hypothetical protein